MKNQKGFAHILILFFLLLAIPLGIYLVQHPTIFKPRASSETDNSPHNIGIRLDSAGKGEFYDKVTNQEFLFRGVNYIKLSEQGHSTFDPGSYNPTEVQTDLDKLHADGYNSVRVFINEYTVGNPEGGLSPEYMQNVTDYLNKAKADDIHVVITFTEVPWYSPTYGFDLAQHYAYGLTGMYLRPELVEGKKRFVKDFVSDLKSSGAPMEYALYSLDNEAAFIYKIFDPRTNSDFIYKPFNLTTYTAPNGISYDLNDPAQKKQMMDASLVYAINLWRGAIKEADPDAVVGIGFYSPNVPEAAPTKAYVNSYWALANPETGGSSADFIDLHIYPDRYPNWSVAKDLEAFEIGPSNTKKPLIIGEFGAEQVLIPKTAPNDRFNEAVSKILDIEVQTCQAGFKGWIFWQYDHPSDYNLLERGGALNNILAPINRADPCSKELTTKPPTQGESFVYGLAGDKFLTGAFTGKKIDTPAAIRSNQWLLRNSNSSGEPNINFVYGNPGDQKLLCDWDGDGIDTPGVYRDGVFYLRNSNTTGEADIHFAYGNPGTKAICGDWDGDGKDSVGVVDGNQWLLRNTNTSGIADVRFVYGISGDQVFAGDWNADGKDTPGVYRNGKFYLRNSNSTGNGDEEFVFGNAGDIAISGDWDGDAKDEVGVVSGNSWSLKTNPKVTPSCIPRPACLDSNPACKMAENSNMCPPSPTEPPPPYSPPPSSTPKPVPPAQTHFNTDINGDGRVNISDAFAILKDLSKVKCGLKTDVNRDCIINTQDILLVIQNYN